MEEQEKEEVIRRYADMVYRLALARTGNRSDADDVFQKVFLRYVQKAPDFTEEEHRKAWLLKVTVNCFVKLLTSLWKKRVGLFSEQQEPEHGTEERGYAEAEGDFVIWRELMNLPEKYRVALHLFYYEELGTEEIGKITGQKPSTVRAQLTRARRMLRERMEAAEHV